MNLNSKRRKLLERLKDKLFRDSFVSAHARAGIAHQIRALRGERKWSQADLAAKVDTTQSVISRWEDPSYGKYSFQKILELASIFDVAVIVRFVSFSELLNRTEDVSSEALAATDFLKDTFGKSQLTSYIAFGMLPKSALDRIVPHSRPANAQADFMLKASQVVEGGPSLVNANQARRFSAISGTAYQPRDLGRGTEAMAIQ